MRHAPLVPVVFALFAVTTGAQDVPAASSPQTPVFRSAANLVAINVTVTDGKQFVSGLQPEDFAVFEDGVQQQVRFFEAEDVPLDLILLIDTSSSMRDKMDVVHEAAIGLTNTLRDGDRGAIVAFADGVDIVQPLSSEKAALEAAIRRTEAYGGTALHNAVYISLRQFGRKAVSAADVRRQAIAVLSDGQDTTSMLKFDDVLKQARGSGVAIYTINLRSEYEPPTAEARRFVSESEYDMRVLARDTGGQAFFPDHAQELKGIYAGIGAELSSQYSLGYVSSNGNADGRFRRIMVRMTSRTDLQPRARTGYLAEGSAVATHAPNPR